MYKNPKITISNISSSTQMHEKYISKLINTFSEGNFNDFINRLRIEEFKRNLEKKSYKNYSILGIAKESGFSSKSTFYKAFKKHEKLSPSEYMKK
ncbi:helix-turn-helix domain-containing protein [Tenacibaculum halocynthiae]|uniref:helix-turn-helix domain-containing protein n=1 Tax=Tenacibaculum halocynthiae TaxID=1254437 RepID=UPI003D66185F